jgi:hypothetical protein
VVVGVDNNGCIFIGIPRYTLERLLAGGRECIPSHVQGTTKVPHFCVYAGETDESLMKQIHDQYPSRPMPPVEDRRT